MKFMTLIICICLTLNALASTADVQKLEKHFDEFQYAMTVEWDQKDQKFFEEKTAEFYKNLQGLKLSEKDILNLAEKKAVGRETIEALKLKLSLMAPDKSAEEIASLLKESSNDLYRTGASLNANVEFTIETILGFAAVILLTLSLDGPDEKCVEYAEKYKCRSQTYGTITDTTCGYEDVCVKWGPK